MKKLNNLINILEELKEDYFEGGLTELDVTRTLMYNIDDLTEQLTIYRNLEEELGEM